MPRLGRVVLPNYPHHIVQRGHNRQAVFAEEADYLYYLNTLEKFKILYDVKVYGFCLTTSHVHLVLQPGDSVAGMGQLMKRLTGRQTRLVICGSGKDRPQIYYVSTCSRLRPMMFKPIQGVVFPNRRKLVKDIVWDQVLSVEVDEIDDDHRKLVDIFNILNHSLTDGSSQDYLTAVLEELINCTIWHFSHEERLMLKYGYEEIEKHKAMHRELIKSAQELQHKFLQTDKPITDEDVEYLENWLTEHILTDDMRLGAYLSQVM